MEISRFLSRFGKVNSKSSYLVSRPSFLSFKSDQKKPWNLLEESFGKRLKSTCSFGMPPLFFVQKNVSSQHLNVFFNSWHGSAKFPFESSPWALDRRHFATDASSGELFEKALKEFESSKQKEVEEKAVTRRKGKRTRASDEAWCIIKGIKSSVKKLKIVCRKISGLSYKEAVLQLRFSPQKVARKYIIKGVESARYNAENNHGLDPDRLLVSEVWIGRETFLKRIRYHGKGRAGLMKRPRSRVTIILKEIPYKPSEKRLGKYGKKHTPEYHQKYMKKLQEEPQEQTTQNQS